MENDYRELCSGAWAHLNPSLCPCHGRGWLLSDLDTWHKCPAHGAGVPHPDDEVTTFDGRAHSLSIYRRAAASYRDSFVKAGGTAKQFKALVVRALAGKKVTPALWVDAAMGIAEVACSEAEEVSARKNGYSCALERRWALEAMWERKEEGRL